jgi:hypothetical protein
MIEVLVAITLLGLFGAATVPLLVTGLRASVVAKLDTGAKNLSQQRFELMRNLPFRIAYDPAITVGVDLLDTYYPGLTAPTGGVTTPGYVTTQARRAGEPATGPFYRTVWHPALAGKTSTQYVSVQFLKPDVTPKTPVTPPAGYSTLSIGNDRAPSTLVGVTVVTEWTIGSKSKRFTVYTEISDVAPGAPLVTLQARAAALRISSTVGLDSDQTDLLLESGVVNIDGSLSSGASAASSATGGYASLTPGTRVSGATRTASAPADVAAGATTDNSSHDLTWLGNFVARVPYSSVSGVAAKTSFGEPIAGTSGTPVTAISQDAIDMRYTNLPTIDSTFGLNNPAYYIARQIAVAGTQQAKSTAYAGSIGGAVHSASVGLAANTSTVQVLQTTYSPEGLIQVRLNSSSLTCGSDGTTPSSAPAYSADIRFRTYTPSAADPSVGTYAWSSWTNLNQAQTTDPLAGVNLTPGAGGVAVGYNNGRLLYLGEYVQNLSSQTASTLSAGRVLSTDGNRVEAKPTAMVNLTTVPLRQDEDLSSVTVALGVLSCVAEDNR